MALIALSKPIDFPTSALRALLSLHAPRFRWQCGDGDMHGSDETAPFDRPQLIMGVGNPDVVMVTARHIATPVAVASSAPPHRTHITLSNATTDDPLLAKQIALVVAAGLTIETDDHAWVQLHPNGNWLSTEDLRTALDAIKAGQPISFIDQLGTSLSMIGAAPVQAPAPAFATSFQSAADLGNSAPLQQRIAQRNAAIAELRRDREMAAPPPYADEGVHIDRLPTLVALLNQPLQLDWAAITEAMNRLDPGDQWTAKCEPDGRGVISGRTGSIVLDRILDPVRGRIIPEALERSYWYQGDRERLDGHTEQLTISASINTRDHPYGEVQATAKVMSLLACLIARQPATAAIYNAGAATISDAADVAEMLTILADNELPIQLWTHTTWRSLEFEAVSCFSSGFAPFLGYEIEVWEAPVSAKFVQVKISDIMRYLLHRGPVIQSGDAFGVREDDKNIRVRFTDSRVDRKHPVFAMNIDFARGSELAASRPERLSDRRGVPTVAPSRAPAAPRGFGRKGL